MISFQTAPRNKNELIKSIQQLGNPVIEVIEVLDRNQKLQITKSFDANIMKGPFSVIILRER
jgi:hypothetical protein